ncbi:MAG: hypothetical protein WCJ88_12195, partial [Actinomycetes bacterium]
GVAPAGAVPTPTGSVSSTNDGTATITYADTTKVEVYIIDGASPCENTNSVPTTGILATIGVAAAMPASPMTVTTATQVGPTPLHALGVGSFNFCMYDVVGSTYTWLNTTSGTVGIYNPPTASLVDNGNGTMTLTWSADGDFSQFVYLLVLSEATTCPADPSGATQTVTGFGLQSTSSGFGPQLPPSPAIIGAGTDAFVFPFTYVPGQTTLPTGPITAGQYLACAYTVGEGDPVLAQSLSIGLGIEPATPAFTG